MNNSDKVMVTRAGTVRFGWVADPAGLKTTMNTVAHGCADVVAHVLAGDTKWLPKYVGFLFGTAAVPNWSDVGTPSPEQSWSLLSSDLSGLGNSNLQLAPISLTPSITIAPSEGASYTGNAVIFTATSETDGALGFSGSGFKATGIDNLDYIYEAVLLAKPDRRYIPLARVSLISGGTYPQKADSKELALFWQLSFF